MSDKLIPYGKQYIDDADISSVSGVLKTDWITQGPKVREFEESLCKYTGAKYAVAVSNGTAALHMAALAAEIQNGDEVITSPLTFAASANCVLYCGGNVVFCDIEPDTGNIAIDKIESLITKKTKAIIPVHYSGHPVDLEKLEKIAKKYNLIVIEDAAHALGAEYKGDKIGNCKYSDMTILSFHPVKHITTGEGGAVLTNRKDLYDKLMAVRTHGITKENFRYYDSKYDGAWYYEMQYLGFNYRITDFQCALGISQMNKLDSFVKRRREIAKIYKEKLADIKGITLPTEKGYAKSSYHLYPIRTESRIKRKKMFDFLRSKNIGVQVHYIPVYSHPYYRNLGYKEGLCPLAEEFYYREISMPMYPALTNEELIYTVNSIKEAVNAI
ncbi:MAG: UDP-4-amino-4,6-dideoxy-N-acetyl-beta-L-altrosamine transaminase [Elusimicrobia bacterium]|nr:UDP-4-amino-4,6-dideoxy-N-acetyl-beta-L-altrosamine transaminase [Elusimicrobiota bacterium]